MPSATRVREGGLAVTLYAVRPALRVIHSDVELWRPAQRSARYVPPWQPPRDVGPEFLQRVLAGLRRL